MVTRTSCNFSVSGLGKDFAVQEGSPTFSHSSQCRAIKWHLHVALPSLLRRRVEGKVRGRGPMCTARQRCRLFYKPSFIGLTLPYKMSLALWGISLNYYYKRVTVLNFAVDVLLSDSSWKVVTHKEQLLPCCSHEFQDLVRLAIHKRDSAISVIRNHQRSPIKILPCNLQNSFIKWSGHEWSLSFTMQLQQWSKHCNFKNREVAQLKMQCLSQSLS